MRLASPPRLIIFDCDGVLIDSEHVASSVVAADLTALGWKMDTQDAMRLFIGMSITDMEPVIAARLGRPLPASWRPALAARLLAALSEHARPIAGARAMLERVNAAGIGWRIASNSSDEEMAVKFTRAGLADLTTGRAHSAASIIAAGGRAKPAGDVFLAAAASAGVPPAACLVLEDSVVGVQGAVAAGMACLGFAPACGGARLLAAGAQGVLHHLDEFMGIGAAIW